MKNQALQKTDNRKDIRSFIQSDAVRQQLAMVLPKHLTPDRMARVACTTIMRNPKLAQCTQESLLNCLMTCSQYGLEPDGRRAHLIPFENRQKNTVECTLIIDWKGLAELALRSGMIAKLHADVICDKDEFEFDMGDILHHKIDFKQPRGTPYAAYAMAVTKTGERFVQVMTKDEIESVRNGSQGWKAFEKGWAKQSPWKDAPGEMWKKTVFRRLSKWLPLSSEYRDLEDVDNEVQVSVPAKDTTPNFEPMALALPESSGGETGPVVEEAHEPSVTTPVTPEPPEPKPHHPPFHDTTKAKATPHEPSVAPVFKPEPPINAVQAEKLVVIDDGQDKPLIYPPNAEPTFEQLVDGPAAAPVDPLAGIRAKMTELGVSEAQLVAFFNNNKGGGTATVASLADIPEASLTRIISSRAMVARIKAQVS